MKAHGAHMLMGQMVLGREGCTKVDRHSSTSDSSSETSGFD